MSNGTYLVCFDGISGGLGEAYFSETQSSRNNLGETRKV